MSKLLVCSCLFFFAAVAIGEDAPAQPAAAIAPAAQKPVTEDGWRWNGKFGAFFNSVGTHNTEHSNDPGIAGSNETIAYQVLVDEAVGWRRDRTSVDQTFVGKYGRQRSQGTDWVESIDQLDYNGTLGYTLQKPHFIYTAWGVNTQITSPEPGNGIFQPGQYKVSAGYGQRYEDMLPEHDKLEFRLGVRAQRRWGSILPPEQKEWEIGPEFVARYERKQTSSLRYWVQYEAFDEFSDLAHVSNLITAALDMQLSKFISASFGVRAYYESLPEDANPALRSHYGSWSWRHEALVGLTIQH